MCVFDINTTYSKGKDSIPLNPSSSIMDYEMFKCTSFVQQRNSDTELTAVCAIYSRYNNFNAAMPSIDLIKVPFKINVRIFVQCSIAAMSSIGVFAKSANYKCVARTSCTIPCEDKSHAHMFNCRRRLHLPNVSRLSSPHWVSVSECNVVIFPTPVILDPCAMLPFLISITRRDGLLLRILMSSTDVCDKMSVDSRGKVCRVCIPAVSTNEPVKSKFFSLTHDDNTVTSRTGFHRSTNTYNCVNW